MEDTTLLLLRLILAILRRGARRGDALEIPRTAAPTATARRGARGAAHVRAVPGEGRAGREDGVVPEDVQAEREPHARPVEGRAHRAVTRAARREQRARWGLGLGRGCRGGRGEAVEDDGGQGAPGGRGADREVGCGHGCGRGGSGRRPGGGEGVRDGTGGALGRAHGGGEAEAEGLDAADVGSDMGVVNTCETGRDKSLNLCVLTNDEKDLRVLSPTRRESDSEGGGIVLVMTGPASVNAERAKVEVVFAAMIVML